MHVRRTRAKIARLSAPIYVLLQLREGHIQFRQLGRETRVGPGECVFIDGTEPLTGQALASARQPAAGQGPTVPRPGSWRRP